MSDPAERLRIARLRAGYETGKDAAVALGVPVSTYLGHAFYARRYKVAEQWLLWGVGKAPGTDDTSVSAEIVDIVEHLPPLKQAEALAILRVLRGSPDNA
jgi:hypothetical protein